MKEKYLTDWEIKMKSDIDKIIEDELKVLIEQEEKTNDLYYKDNPAACEIYRSRKQAEYEREYRDNYTLNILKKCGMDINAFERTWMGVCERSSILLGLIQDKIDGFYYNDNERIISNHKMDLNNTRVKYEEGVLTIKDNDTSYEFYVDENQIIYVNGENVLNLVPVPTSNKENKMIKELMNNMSIDKITHEKCLKK